MGICDVRARDRPVAPRFGQHGVELVLGPRDQSEPSTSPGGSQRDRTPDAARGARDDGDRAVPAVRTQGASTSTTVARLIPPPAHRVATPYPPPRRRSSWISVTRIRAPEQATG